MLICSFGQLVLVFLLSCFTEAVNVMGEKVGEKIAFICTFRHPASIFSCISNGYIKFKATIYFFKVDSLDNKNFKIFKSIDCIRQKIRFYGLHEFRIRIKVDRLRI